MSRSRKHKGPPKPLPDARAQAGSAGSGPAAAAAPRPALETQVWLGYLFLAVGLILLTVGYLTWRLVEMDAFFNSDTLFPAALYKDLFHRGGSLSDWYLIPPPYFFPEYPLHFLTNALAPNPFWAIAAFFVLQIVLTFFALVWLNRLFLDRGKAFLFAGMSLLSLCYLCIESTSSLSPFRCLALSVTHFGTFVVGLVVFRLAATAILWPGGRVKKEYLVLILVLSLLTSLSDAIFAIQFCAPVVIASIYLWAKCVIPWRRALIVASSTVAGTAGGFIVYNHLGLNLSWYFARADVSFLSRNASDLGRLFLHLWQTHPSWLVLCALVWVALFFMWAFVDKLEELGRPLSGPAKFLTAFCLASGGLALASCLPSSMTVAVRYFIPVFFLPVFLAPYVILVIKPGGLKIAAIGIWTVGVCAAAIFVLASNRQPFAFHANYYPKEIQCMDDAFQKYGLENGIAAYWDARRTVVLAKTEVNIAQVNYKLAMHLWNVSKKTFKDSYDFAIIDPGASPFYRLNEELIKAVNGEPSDTVLCGKRKILIYPKDGLRLRGGMMPRFIYEEGPGQ